MEIYRQTEGSTDSEADVESLLFVHDALLTKYPNVWHSIPYRIKMSTMHVYLQLLSAKCWLIKVQKPQKKLYLYNSNVSPPY